MWIESSFWSTHTLCAFTEANPNTHYQECYIRDKSMQPCICIHITAFSEMTQQNVTRGNGNVINIPTWCMNTTNQLIDLGASVSKMHVLRSFLVSQSWPKTMPRTPLQCLQGTMFATICKPWFGPLMSIAVIHSSTALSIIMVAMQQVPYSYSW